MVAAVSAAFANLAIPSRVNRNTVHSSINFYRTLGAKPMDEWTVFRLTRDGIARLANEERVEQEQDHEHEEEEEEES